MIVNSLFYTGLVEECAELIKACTKAERFGLDDRHPRTGVANRDQLIEEAGDVLAHIAMLLNEAGVDGARVRERAEFKQSKFCSHHNLSLRKP